MKADYTIKVEPSGSWRNAQEVMISLIVTYDTGQRKVFKGIIKADK